MHFRKNIFSATLFLLPALIMFALFIIYPMTQGVYLSFFKWSGIPSVVPEFVGLDNYIRLFSDNKFWSSMYNVGVFIASGFFIIMPVSLLLALIITSKIRMRRIFKTAFFMPVVLSKTAIALMFSFLLLPSGLINTVLTDMGLGLFSMDWLGNPNIAIYTVVLVNAWIYFGLNMIIFASGLVSIPTQLYEAARIDGANDYKLLVHITLPNLTNVLKIVSVLVITGSLQAFEVVYVLTKGGPGGATEVPNILMYNAAFSYQSFGYSYTIGSVLLFIALGATIILDYFFRRKEKQMGV